MEKKHLGFIIVIFCVYIVQAFFFNVFGANAPVMMDFYSITPTQQGLIFSMLSIGALFMSIYLTLYGERYNKINVVAAAMLVLGATGIVVGLAPPYIMLVILIMASGAAYSSIDVMMNSLIPEIYPKQKNTLLPILHGFFGMGSVMTPVLVTALVNPDFPDTFTKPFQLTGGIMLSLLVIFFIAGRRILPETPYADMAAIRKRVSDNPAEILKEYKAWVFLVAGIFYFSFLIGIINWLPAYCREAGMDFNASAAMLTTFLAGSLTMRFCGPLILKRVTVRNAYIFFGLISAAAVAAALFAGKAAMMTALLFIGGFAQGSCVALLVLMSTGAFPHRVASASSLIFIASSLAGITAPLWMGVLAEYTGFRIPLLLICALMAISVALIIRAEK